MTVVTIRSILRRVGPIAGYRDYRAHDERLLAPLKSARECPSIASKINRGESVGAGRRLAPSSQGKQSCSVARCLLLSPPYCFRAPADAACSIACVVCVPAIALGSRHIPGTADAAAARRIGTSGSAILRLAAIRATAAAATRAATTSTNAVIAATVTTVAVAEGRSSTISERWTRPHRVGGRWVANRRHLRNQPRRPGLSHCLRQHPHAVLGATNRVR